MPPTPAAVPSRRGVLLAVASVVIVPSMPRSVTAGPGAPTVWTMLDVNRTVAQADAHLLEFPDGRRFLVDAANRGLGLPERLRARGVHHLDAVVISHPHKDHYGGLTELLEAGLGVGRVYVNEPLPAVCDTERPWGCDLAHVRETIAAVRARGIAVRPLAAGQVLHEAGGSRLVVLHAFDGQQTPVGATDVNDTSVLLLLSHGATRALFTGDLNRPLGAWLAREGQALEAQLVKVPHHGAEAIAPPEFLDRVGAETALVPAPAGLWASDRCRPTREHLAGRRVRTLVNGVHGDVTVTLEPDGYTIAAEHP